MQEIVHHNLYPRYYISKSKIFSTANAPTAKITQERRTPPIVIAISIMPVVDQEGAENKHVSVDIMVKENQLLADARIRSTSYRNVDIFDIRLNREEQSLLMAINQGLRPAAGGEKTLPTLLLYDQTGLKLFEEITYLQDYYLTNAEIEVLEHCADEIAQRLQQDSIVLELGSG